MKGTIAAVVTVCAIGGAAFLVDQVLRTLRALDVVERERDSWQRPEEILHHLDLHPSDTVLDFGSGAGYFALEIAPRVAASGQVVAVDLRRQSLAFLWLRAKIARRGNISVVHATVDDPSIPAGPIDAVLIANTYHELTAPATILEGIFTSMRRGGRLVVVDRGPRTAAEHEDAAHHEVSPARAEREITAHGFETILRDERFIDRAREPDVWWLMVFRKP